MRSRWWSAALASAVVACGGETCPAGLVPAEGRCVPPACGACAPPTPFCDDALGRCVACRSDDDCGDPAAPRCDASGACVQCLEQEACTDPAASACASEGACVPCVRDAECDHLRGLPRCAGATGTCAECLPATEGEDCGGTACDPVDAECTDAALGTLALCVPCRADSECLPGHACVETFFDGASDGFHCLLQAEQCPGPSPLEPVESRSGAAPARYCRPDPTRTTCAAYRDVIDGKTCERDEECGRPGVDDGRCVNGSCSFPCVDDNQSCVKGSALRGNCSGGVCIVQGR